MNTMQVAFKTAGINPAIFTKRVKWPRKRYNRTCGIQRDVKTGQKVGKVN